MLRLRLDPAGRDHVAGRAARSVVPFRNGVPAPRPRVIRARTRPAGSLPWSLTSVTTPSTARVAPSSSTPPSCSPTRGRCSASPSTRWCSPSSSSPSSRPSGTTASSATSPGRRCGCWTTCASSTAGSTRRCPRHDGGTLRVELNHTDPTALPAGFRLGDNDTRILAVAKNLADEGLLVTVVCKDLPMRVKASAVGLDAEEYRAELAVDSGWTGMAELDVASSRWPQLYEHEQIEHARGGRACPATPASCCSRPRGSALGRVGADKQVRLVRGDRDVFGLHGRSAEQRIAIDLLLDDEIGIVSLGGRAGTGKSALALCAGLEAVMERRQHRKVVVFRPLYAVGGQDLGYLPGTESEKMGPWAQAVFDTLGALVSTGGRRGGHGPRHARGPAPHPHPRPLACTTRSSIVDEAQSLERNVLLTVLSPHRPELARGAHPRRRPARQPAGRPARRRRRGDRGAQGPPAVRARHADPLGALPGRRAGHRDAGEHRAVTPATRRARRAEQVARMSSPVTKITDWTRPGASVIVVSSQHP